MYFAMMSPILYALHGEYTKEFTFKKRKKVNGIGYGDSNSDDIITLI
jgi:hypothetical protein